MSQRSEGAGAGDDAGLAVRAAGGDREAFGRLVERWTPQARRVARAVLRDPDDADDAAQDAFLAALVKLERYDPGRPFGPWLMRIVANAATDRRRRRAVRQAEPLDPALPGG
ncbi:MAG: sigma-70 family RNA polymerase sigma factor, partial [Gemmatimonadales bacterium]